ncbi:MAG TPA: pyridoxal-phosphate dependent enzyme [Gaiellaceae bacterium]|nr:pyridoxal-phosphate dependent enzyme [Gaiellaceae bacterium]
MRTPLVRLELDDAPAEIWLKLESFQPVGAFKIRGAANAILSAPPAALANGVVTTSTGNMAQGVAWMARKLGLPATIVVPDNASTTKLAAVERMGGRIVRVPWSEWWGALEAGRVDGIGGFFVHPVSDDPVIAGNGTIGLELVEELDGIDAVLTPWGGGGLTTGVASALHALSPATKVFACEPENGAPLTAAFANGGVPVAVDFTPSFVDGAGAGALLPVMWEHARSLVTGSFAVSLEAAASTVKLLLERGRIVAEGAAALSVAAALEGRAGSGRVVCVVSGGNIDAARLSTILDGRVPD